MSKELKFPTGGRDGRDEELGALIAPLYRAPGDERYWDGLHARILQRVREAAPSLVPEDGGEWWWVLNRWARMGAAAAVLAAVLAGALVVRHEAMESRLAAEALLNEPPTYTLHVAIQEPGQAPVNPTLRYGHP